MFLYLACNIASWMSGIGLINYCLDILESPVVTDWGLSDGIYQLRILGNDHFLVHASKKYFYRLS